MKKPKGPADSRSVSVYLTCTEYGQIMENFSVSDCHSLSEFIRGKIFKKSSTVFYRNRTVDDLISELIEIKKALFKIKDECADQLSEIRKFGPEFPSRESRQKAVVEKMAGEMEKLRLLMIKIYDECSRS